MAYKVDADWKRMRENHLLTYPACAVCDDPNRPVVHHLRYRGKRGKSELPGDLVTLCKFHHADLHRSLRPKATSVQGTIDYIAQKRLELVLELFAAADRAEVARAPQ